MNDDDELNINPPTPCLGKRPQRPKPKGPGLPVRPFSSPEGGGSLTHAVSRTVMPSSALNRACFTLHTTVVMNAKLVCASSWWPFLEFINFFSFRRSENLKFSPGRFLCGPGRARRELQTRAAECRSELGCAHFRSVGVACQSFGCSFIWTFFF